ncbi:MAG: type II toxin-antitoxin system RatA family toxin [Alphaproteobacteria bacterium]|nr:type II toxin-antitoxin system RatA family toxin [Alphaproteobacteria bacterium]
MPTHAEKRVVPYRAEQMFALVADVERYPEFLPWCVGARVTRRQEAVIWADLIIGYKLIRERFTSKVTLAEAQQRIDVEYTDGPFRYLNNHWIFEPTDAGCVVDFYVDFEFKNLFLQRVMGLFFNEAVRRMVRAFESRAHALYGDG